MKKSLAAVLAMIIGGAGAYALGTTAGKEISNSVTLSYTAGGVAQEPVSSNTDTFKVDKKVDMILYTTDTDQIVVTPGQTDRITHFRFENEGNADQNFSFSVANLATDQEADYNDRKDSDDVQDLLIQCTYTAPGGTTETQTWTAGPVTLEIEENGTAECNVSADINEPDTTPSVNDPGKGDDGDVMNIELLATAVKPNGDPEENSTSESANTVDVVLADGFDDETLGAAEEHNSSDGHKGDTPLDGKEAARSGYIIATPVLTAKKESCVISDPVHGDSNDAKRIPGAVIRYLFDINNTGSGDVDELNITDTFNDYLDVSGLPTSAKKSESQDNACSCETQTDSEAISSQDVIMNGQEMTITNIEVNSSKHTCVWVEVEIE